MHRFPSRLFQSTSPLIFLAVAGLMVVTAACASRTTPSPTLVSLPTLGNPSPFVETATVPEVSTPEPSPEPSATSSATAVLLPTVTPAAIPTETPAATSVRTGGGISQVKIFLIAIGDNGKSGAMIGCGDSVVGVERVIAPTRAPLTAALNELFSLHDQFYGQSGLYNTLHQSDLHLQSVSIVNAVATIKITGTLSLGGVCDDPRVKAQIESTALQFSTVRAVNAFLNGIPLATVLSEK